MPVSIFTIPRMRSLSQSWCESNCIPLYTARALDAVLKRFSSDQENRFEVLNITSLVFEEACRLFAAHSRKLSLRTLDSLQAAAFMTYCEIEQDSFVCADRRLADVLSQEGAEVLLVGL